ncbi:MAG TPA: NAD(P)-binding domain-containing protein [Bdellovibrionota bacterium]
MTANQFLNYLQDFVVEHFGLLGILACGSLAAWQVWSRNKKHELAKKALDHSIRMQIHEPLTLHPEINPTVCSGCAACTAVCPEGDILRIIDHKAVLVSPIRCLGHGECERSCPTGAITLVFGTKTRGMEIPRISTHYETNVPGIYISGELGGMGLIRNAFKQGHLATTHAISNLKKNVKTDTSVLVIGAGPAGLASSLTAAARNEKYIWIEQNSFGGTITNFPRQKIIMSHPAEVPGVWSMKFPSNRVSKEQLMEQWLSVKDKHKLEIREHTKFESLENMGSHFSVKTDQGVITTQKVILCTNVRGTPRKLGIKNEDMMKVTYNLLEPDQYQGMDVAVVGAGNSAVEAAKHLANPEYKNRVTLLVRGKGFERCNATNQKIIQEMAEEKLVDIWYESNVLEIEKDYLTVWKDNEPVSLANDFLFIFAGAELPQKFLMSLGVKIDKRFGTPRV